jgi:hypothetical protein
MIKADFNITENAMGRFQIPLGCSDRGQKSLIWDTQSVGAQVLEKAQLVSRAWQQTRQQTFKAIFGELITCDDLIELLLRDGGRLFVTRNGGGNSHVIGRYFVFLGHGEAHGVATCALMR